MYVQQGENHFALLSEPSVPLLSFTTVCDRRQFGCLSEYHHDRLCEGTWAAHQPPETIIPSYPRPRHWRTLGKGAVRERACASDGHDGLGPRRVIGLGCCCQDKQLCLCLGQVFHSVSAYWEHPNQYQPPFMAESVCMCWTLALNRGHWFVFGMCCKALPTSLLFCVSCLSLCVCMCVFLGSVVKWKIWRWWCRIWSLRPSRLWTVWRKEYSCLTCFSTCLDERSFSHTLSLQFTHTLSPPLKPCTLSDCYSS